MKIYTSYFSNAAKLKAANVEMIGIALYPPKWFVGISLLKVAPTRELFNSPNLSDEEYEKRFRKEVLSKQDAMNIHNLLERMGGGKDVALCCYEKNINECHRKIVGEWLSEELGIEVPEFGTEVKAPKPVETFEEPTLF